MFSPGVMADIPLITYQVQCPVSVRMVMYALSKKSFATTKGQNENSKLTMQISYIKSSPNIQYLNNSLFCFGLLKE